MFTIYDFGIVDLDNDGSEELVMTGFPETTQVLDYQEGKVYSYQFVYRGMKGITASGVYNSSSGADIGGFHRIYLDKGNYKEETLAYMEHDHFEVEGIEVTSQEFFAYTETFANSEQMETTDFTEGMLDKILLGSLREEELKIIARRKRVLKYNIGSLMEELPGWNMDGKRNRQGKNTFMWCQVLMKKVRTCC